MNFKFTLIDVVCRKHEDSVNLDTKTGKKSNYPDVMVKFS